MLYIISAPSGAGKSTLIKGFLKTNYNFNVRLSISYTTRSIRPGEINGKDYFFISIKKFKNMIKQGCFLEYANVFGNYYGTVRKDIESMINNGINIFLDIDWQGAKQIKYKIKNTRSIFILPPSRDELNRRLKNRGQDSDEIIKNRMICANNEISHHIDYDYIIINDNFVKALTDLKNIINTESYYYFQK